MNLQAFDFRERTIACCADMRHLDLASKCNDDDDGGLDSSDEA